MRGGDVSMGSPRLEPSRGDLKRKIQQLEASLASWRDIAAHERRRAEAAEEATRRAWRLAGASTRREERSCH